MRFLLLVSLVNPSTVNSPNKVAAYLLATECASEPGKARCQTLGGTCMIESDGYYTVSAICVAIGAILLVAYIWPAARRLQRKLHFLTLCVTTTERMFRTTWVCMESKLSKKGLIRHIKVRGPSNTITCIILLEECNHKYKWNDPVNQSTTT